MAETLSSLLAGIDYPPVTVVALGYGPEAASSVPKGFGVLVPRGEGLRSLGCLWDSHIFPNRAPDGGLLLRVMVGGAVDPPAASLDEGELVALVRDELERLLGLVAEPRHCRVIRWPRAIPQYEIGHPRRVRAVTGCLAEIPGLFLAGNALSGVAFGKAAAAGVAAGEEVVRYLSGE